MDKVNKTRSIAVDSNNKLVFPQISELIEANPELGGGNLPDNIQVSDDGTVEINSVLKTNGIHETQLYKNIPQGSYEYKGWYFASKFSLVSGTETDNIDEICENHYQVLLGDTQQEYSTISNIDPQTQSDSSSSILANLADGDILTFKNSSNYIDSVEVLDVSGNCLTFKYIPGKFLDNNPTKRNLPQLQSYTTDNPLNASVRCNAKPDAGPTLISGGSTATNIGGGSNTTRGYFATTIGGSCNTNSGDFTIVGGENNIVNGKSSIILGIDNSNNQEKNYVLGNKIDTQYREGYVLGRHLTTTNNHQTIIGLGNDTSYNSNYSVVVATGWDVGDIAGEAGIYSNYNSIEATQSNLTLRAVDEVLVDSKNSIIINAGGVEAKSYITMDRQFLYAYGQYTTFGGETVKINSSTATLNAPRIELTGQSIGTNINIGTSSLTNSDGFTITLGKGLTRDIIENDQRTQVIVGQYNQAVGNGKVSGTPCFIVGNGSSSVKHNAIEVYTDKLKINNDVELNNIKSNSDINISSDSNINLKYGDSTVIGITDELTLTSDTINVNGDFIEVNGFLHTNEGSIGGNGTLHLTTDGAFDTVASVHYNTISFLIGNNDAGANFDFNIDGTFTGFKHAGPGAAADKTTGFSLGVSNGLNINSYNESTTITNSATYSANGISLTDTTITNELNINNTGITYQLLSLKQPTSEISIDRNGINVKPSSDYQSSNFVGGISITGDMLKLNGVPEEFEGGNRVEITNKAIKFYDCYENEGLKITDYCIDFENSTNSSYITNLETLTVNRHGDNSTISINGDKISFGTGLVIGEAYGSGLNNDIQLLQAVVGEANISGMLTTKLLRDNNSTQIDINSGEYTDCLLNKLSREYVGPDPDTEEPVFSEHDFDGFDKTAVGLDYFYNVIKELNARIKELESTGSSTDPVDQIKLKIDGTDEYCIVKAKKDETGAIILTWK